jgi:hypothetical protein
MLIKFIFFSFFLIELFGFFGRKSSEDTEVELDILIKKSYFFKDFLEIKKIKEGKKFYSYIHLFY